MLSTWLFVFASLNSILRLLLYTHSYSPPFVGIFNYTRRITVSGILYLTARKGSPQLITDVLNISLAARSKQPWHLSKPIHLWVHLQQRRHRATYYLEGEVPPLSSPRKTSSCTRLRLEEMAFLPNAPPPPPRLRLLGGRQHLHQVQPPKQLDQHQAVD